MDIAARKVPIEEQNLGREARNLSIFLCCALKASQNIVSPLVPRAATDKRASADDRRSALWDTGSIFQALNKVFYLAACSNWPKRLFTPKRAISASY